MILSNASLLILTVSVIFFGAPQLGFAGDGVRCGDFNEAIHSPYSTLDHF